MDDASFLDTSAPMSTIHIDISSSGAEEYRLAKICMSNQKFRGTHTEMLCSSGGTAVRFSARYLHSRWERWTRYRNEGAGGRAAHSNLVLPGSGMIRAVLLSTAAASNRSLRKCSNAATLTPRRWPNTAMQRSRLQLLGGRPPAANLAIMDHNLCMGTSISMAIIRWLLKRS